MSEEKHSKEWLEGYKVGREEGVEVAENMAKLAIAVHRKESHRAGLLRGAEIARNSETDTQRILGSIECNSPHSEDIAALIEAEAKEERDN